VLEAPTLPHFLVLECFLDRNHLPGAWVSATLEMARRNAFNLILGPADAAGMLKVSRSQLLERAQQDRDLFPLDFVNPATDWTGRIRVDVINLADVNKALQAHRSFKHLIAYPPDFDARLTELAARLKQSPGELLSVRAAAVPVGSAILEAAQLKAVS
jgi:hypothetical protein